MKIKKLILLIFIINLALITNSSAQTTQAAADIINKLGSFSLDTYIFLVIIFAELIIILFLVNTLMQIVKSKIGVKALTETAVPQVESKSKFKTWFQKFNETVAIEDEDKLDLNHNYDGVRELDNKTPGWWIYAFYGTILFSVIYLYRVFVSGSMPGQLDELNMEYAMAEKVKSTMLTTNTNTNNIDENTVSMLDANAISKGALTYKTNCVVCHGEKGEGNAVGPNLTDVYWIHKGSVQEIFKTIKYGWPDKGMKSWKDDFSPLQIAELTSYVKTLQGTNPPNAKEKQGEFYIDSSLMSTKIDTIK